MFHVLAWVILVDMRSVFIPCVSGGDPCRYDGSLISLRKLGIKKEPDFSVAALDYDDPETYKMLGQGETEGVFSSNLRA